MKAPGLSCRIMLCTGWKQRDRVLFPCCYPWAPMRLPLANCFLLSSAEYPPRQVCSCFTSYALQLLCGSGLLSAVSQNVSDFAHLITRSRAGASPAVPCTKLLAWWDTAWLLPACHRWNINSAEHHPKGLGHQKKMVWSSCPPREVEGCSRGGRLESASPPSPLSWRFRRWEALSLAEWVTPHIFFWDMVFPKKGTCSWSEQCCCQAAVWAAIQLHVPIDSSLRGMCYKSTKSCLQPNLLRNE